MNSNSQHSVLSQLLNRDPNVGFNSITSASASAAAAAPLVDQSLSKDFEEVFKNKKLADVTLLVNDVPYRAHKVILAARSAVFESIFESPHDDQLTITAIKTEVMEEVLRYIYTGKPEKVDLLAKDLLTAASIYELEGLKTICGKSLMKTASVSNVFDLWMFANENCAEEFKRDVLKFIVANFAQIMNTETWKRLAFDATNFKMMREICEAFSLNRYPAYQPFSQASQARMFPQYHTCFNGTTRQEYGYGASPFSNHEKVVDHQ